MDICKKTQLVERLSRATDDWEVVILCWGEEGSRETVSVAGSVSRSEDILGGIIQTRNNIAGGGNQSSIFRRSFLDYGTQMGHVVVHRL